MLSCEQIIETIRREPKIPAPSHTVFKVLELTKDPDCDINKVAAVVHRDGGLTAQLLRQANSSLYGYGGRTSSVAAACMRLGLKQVRSAVINQHIVNGLSSARPPAFEPCRYWQAALATSVAAQDLCRQFLPEQAEDAGTAGLLCDIGIGLLAFGVPKQYEQVLEQASQSPYPKFEEIETRLLGVTHSRVGAEVLSDWGLDKHIIQAVRCHHHDPMAGGTEDPGKFSRTVAAGVTLSEIALQGADMDGVAVLFSHLEHLAPSPDAVVAKLLDTLVAHIQKTAESLSVEIGSTGRMEENFEHLLRDVPDVGARMSFRPMRG